MKGNILGKMRGGSRLRALRQHRLQVFLACFDDFCQGECSAEYVKFRFEKLKASGFKIKS